MESILPQCSNHPSGNWGDCHKQEHVDSPTLEDQGMGVRADHACGTGTGEAYLGSTDIPGKDGRQGHTEWWTQWALILDVAWVSGKQGKGKKILLTQRWNPVLYLLCLLLLPNRCLSYWKPVCLNFFFSIFIKTLNRATQSLMEPTLTPHQSYLTKQIIILDLPPQTSAL